MAASAAAEPRLPAPAALPSELAGPADRARRELSRGADALRRMLHRHGSQWSQQQLLISAIATRIQAAVVTLCVCQHAARQDDPTVRLAAGVLCQELALKQTGRIPSERYARQVGSLAQAIEAGDFTPIADLPQGEILLPYPASPHAPPH
jgi:hypothetical protein